MKLASYSMEIIQSTESETIKDATIMEEIESDGPLATASSSSLIAKKLVDFTLARILTDIQSGNVHHDDLASLTVSLVDISGGGDEGSISLSISDADLDEYIDETIRAATNSAMDPRQDSPICEALLDTFMINILKRLIKDLEEEALTKEQVDSLAKSVKEETKLFTDTSDLDLKNVDDIRYVLLSLLTQLKSGDIDTQTLYQIVFAIVYSYSMIKSPPTPSYENKVTDLLKDVLTRAEEKATSGQLGNVNTSIVHEANDRLSHTHLDICKIEKISSSIMTMSTKSEIVCKTSTSDIARSIVEDALIKAKDQIEQVDVDDGVVEGVENIAEAVILVLAPESQSPPLVTVFVEILENLKDCIEQSDMFDQEQLQEFRNLIRLVQSHSIGPDEVADMAASIAEIVKNPPRSESSTTAIYVVKDTLKAIRDDFLKGNMEDTIIKEMVDIIHLSCRNIISSDPKSPELLTCLADFIRSILKLLTAKVQSGELGQSDIAELTETLKASFDAKATKSETENNQTRDLTKSQTTGVDNELGFLLKTDNVLDYLTYLIDNIETGDMNSDEIRDLGNKLIESGRTLMTSVSEKVSSINTDDAAEGAVEELLRTLKMEIDSGILTKDSLKEITKSIIVSSSDSDFADELFTGTIRSIERDVERGYHVKDIPSVPSLDQSPSASTVASYLVVQTIGDIKSYMSRRGMSRDMIGSVASSILSFLSDGKSDVGLLPVEFEHHRSTIVNLISYLRDDEISATEAEKLFCVILEKYKDVLTGKDIGKRDASGLSNDDILLVENLVNETIFHIQRSVERGKLFDKEFSLPSATNSDDTSQVASHVVENCLQTIRNHIKEEDEGPKPQKSMNIVDFVITIVDKLRSELQNGTISSLSMATFYKAISSDKEDLKALEANAVDNLSLVLYDIETKRSKSVYISRIMDTYLTPLHVSSTTSVSVTDPVKAVESILVSVSSEILTKFVKATLETLIMDLRDGASSTGLEAESSVYVLRTTSSIVAENVIKKVIDRIKNDLENAMQDENIKVNKTKIERAASKLVASESQENTLTENEKSKERLQSLSGHGSSIISKAAEDIVLETLHNIVSNLRLEQSLQTEVGEQTEGESDSVASQAIDDFVLQTLQNIVTDLQDRRSQMDLGVLKTETGSETGGADLVSKDSLMATTYVNGVLHTVLQDMKSKNSTKSNTSLMADRTVKIKSPLDLEGSVIDALIKVMSGTTIEKHVPLLEDTQRDSVRKILTESIKKTIVHVKQGAFSQTQLITMLEGLSKCVEDQGGLEAIGENTPNLQSKVLSILLALSAKVENMSINEEMMNKLSSHLATVGMETASESPSSSNEAASNSSMASSEISDLVKDIISRISQQLSLDNVPVHSADGPAKETATDDDTEDNNVIDKNFNRRNSASSSCPSTLNRDNSDSSSTSLTHSVPKRKNNDTIKERENETRIMPFTDIKKGPVNRRSTENKSDNKLLDRRSMPKPSIYKLQGKTTSMLQTSKGTGSAKFKKDTPVPGYYRSYRKANRVSNPKTHQEMSACAVTSNATPVRSMEIKPRLTNRPKMRSPDLSERSPEDYSKRVQVAHTDPIPEGPLELKSLCGSHKTRIRYRSTIDNQSESTTDDGSYTSELF